MSRPRQRAGGGAGSWSAVLDEIAATTRTCAYDRTGLGSSDPRGRRSLAEAGADLRRLLDTAGERPPFVLVAIRSAVPTPASSPPTIEPIRGPSCCSTRSSRTWKPR